MNPLTHSRLCVHLLLILGVWGLTWAPPATAATPPRPLRVLFIGNSYTYNNNLPAQLEGLARSAQPPVPIETRTVARPGVRLQQHWDRGEALAALRQGRWDYVVLQEQSTLGLLLIEGRHEVNDPELAFHPYARRFAEEARRVGAQPLFLLTWARRDTPESQARLTQAYMAVARELGAPIIPAGLAWARARQESPQLALYHQDGSHPSPAGTYLTASALFATLTGRSPVGLASTLTGHPMPEGVLNPARTVKLATLSPEEAEPLQRVAWTTYEELRQSGGYVEVEPPAPALPTLPEGQPLGTVLLQGTWQGQLRFYSQEAGQSPATLHLALKQEAEHLGGTVRIVFPNGKEEGPFPLEALAVEPSRLRFATPLLGNGRGTVEHEAVLTSEGLVGLARYENPRNHDRYVGTWKLQREGLPASPSEFSDYEASLPCP
ncbi:SGNH/GDSL hydrolase family protein [Hyalangium rubrum]|uniref:SGNH/GDSL hydrolase family protein n=1 Tax=Hyalangium rubrum TaxID=3103134 RepID=A0ABU5GWT3_9BACT|nr:SGNH/GDSL hydrolase family protein [Hyalangium sp. s54d21]MDY7225650.1 SGNH/GDSL hydrolase family protein [Hyalangium sp. s54d21]